MLKCCAEIFNDSRTTNQARHHPFLMYESAYKRASQACCSITVFQGEELLGEGSGFAISADGLVVTAAHVVTCRMPIRESDYKDPTVRIFAKFPNFSLIEYRVAICGIHISDAALTQAAQIDQALLCPISQVKLPFPPFQIGQPPSLGEEVHFCGYSDELELPFGIHRLLEPTSSVAVQFRQSLHRRGRAQNVAGPMIKRGVVGNVLIVSTKERQSNEEITCNVFYIDNGIHSGASGGPVFNREGQAVGVIVQRATTSASQAADSSLLVPSGSTVALSLQTVPFMYRKASRA